MNPVGYCAQNKLQGMKRTKKIHMAVRHRHVDKSKNLRVLFLEMFGVFFLELLNTAGGIYKFLLAGKKRMAGRTDLDFDCLVNRTKLYFITTGTLGLNLMVCGMDIGFHYSLSLQKTCSQHGDY